MEVKVPKNNSDIYVLLSYNIARKVELALKQLFIQKISNKYGNEWKKKILNKDQFVYDAVYSLLGYDTDDINEFMKKVSFGRLNILYKKFYPLFLNNKIQKERFFVSFSNLVEIRNNELGHPTEKYSLGNYMQVLVYALDICQIDLEKLGKLNYLIQKSMEDPTQFQFDDFVELPKKYNEMKIKSKLPNGDYHNDTGGFIGRKEIKEKLYNILESPETGIIYSVVGIGGIGKTTLVVETINELIKNNSSTYQQYIFCSAKTQVLKETIYDIKPEIQDLNQFLSILLKDLMESESFKKDIDVMTLKEKQNYVCSLLEEKKTLIIVDNLETFKDTRLISFIDEAPRHTTFIITSRVPLNHREVKIELEGFTEDEAIEYFKAIAYKKGKDDLFNLSEEQIKEYVGNVHHHPLAIKWSLGQVIVKGKDINLAFKKVINNESDIVKFCFDHLYEQINMDEKKVLAVLSYGDNRYNYYDLGKISDVFNERLDKVISELRDQSLISTLIETNNYGKPETYYQLRPMARAYVINGLEKEEFSKNKSEILSRLGEFNQVESSIKEKVQKQINRYKRKKIDYKELSDYINDMIISHTGSVEIYNEIIPLEFEEKHYNHVVKLCETAIEKYKHNHVPVYKYYLGRSFLENKNAFLLGKAVYYLNQYVTENPKDIQGVRYLGKALTYYGKPEEALEMYSKMLGNFTKIRDIKDMFIFECHARNKQIELLISKKQDYAEALKIAMETKKTIQVKQKQGLIFDELRILNSEILSQIGFCYEKKFEFKSAVYYYDQIINNIGPLLNTKLSMKDLSNLPNEYISACTRCISIFKKDDNKKLVKRYYNKASECFKAHHFRLDYKGSRKTKRDKHLRYLESTYNYLNNYNHNDRTIREGYINYFKDKSNNPFGDIIDSQTGFVYWFNINMVSGYKEEDKNYFVKMINRWLNDKTSICFEVYQNKYKENLLSARNLKLKS